MNHIDGRVAVIADAARASSADQQRAATSNPNAIPLQTDPVSYVWHVMVQENGEADTHALTVGDPYPIVVATVSQRSNHRWLVTAHQHLDPARHQRAHARTLAQAKQIAEVLANAEYMRLSNLRRYRRKPLHEA